jgi:protein phosphatase
VNEQLKAGAISADEAKHSRFKNIITRSVGFEREVQVDLKAFGVEAGDAIVVCCDGLTNLVEDDEILRIAAEAPLAEAPARLVALANGRGGDDNISVILIRVGSPDAA